MSANTQILSASCNKCGAGLELPPGLRFATCQFCGSRLEVRFSGGAVFTEVLDEGNDGDRQIARDLQLIKLQNELNRLDQEWNLKREDYRSYEKGGRRSQLPDGRQTLSTMAVAILMAGFGVYCTTSSHPAPFAIVPIVFSIGMVASAFARYGRFANARARYEGRRQAMLDTIDRLEPHHAIIPTAQG